MIFVEEEVFSKSYCNFHYSEYDWVNVDIKAHSGLVLGYWHSRGGETRGKLTVVSRARDTIEYRTYGPATLTFPNDCVTHAYRLRMRFRASCCVLRSRSRSSSRVTVTCARSHVSDTLLQISPLVYKYVPVFFLLRHHETGATITRRMSFAWDCFNSIELLCLGKACTKCFRVSRLLTSIVLID